MDKYAILQSGFVTDKFDRLEKSEDAAIDFKSIILNKAYYKDESRYFYSPSVNNLFKQYNENNNIISNFDFKENIIKVTYQMLDNKPFIVWLQLQNKYALTNSLHKKFIDETLDYLLLYKDRYTSLSQWIGLLNVNVNKTDSVLLGSLTEEQQSNGDILYFYNNNLKERYDVTYQIKQDFTNTLSSWLDRRDGYLDLLFTMYIIFGDKISMKIS